MCHDAPVPAEMLAHAASRTCDRKAASWLTSPPSKLKLPVVTSSSWTSVTMTAGVAAPSSAERATFVAAANTPVAKTEGATLARSAAPTLTVLTMSKTSGGDAGGCWGGGGS